MTKKERVLAALNHKAVDRVPKGETWIDGTLANRIMGTNYLYNLCKALFTYPKN